ncbi:4-(cytidine 5'-diphospho)-2-C-methyl-D-erythritol kinase [Bacillota bacterium LX-D]|nr:4-(cytidine 5'-diphospho)-2-C-methyl-D-erythritol kinase [Bacillota bacterium LX-D]
MDNLTINAYAKINLTLDVFRLRPDGFHEVQMVMQSISLKDRLSFAPASTLTLTATDPQLVNDQTNLVMKSAELLMSKTGVKKGAAIKIEKNIPLAAGLAGGSSDAAAALLGLNILWDLGLTIGDLITIGAELGSDVPFCLIGGTILAQGRGEILRFLPKIPKLWLVLVKPDFGVSTKEVYQRWDELGEKLPEQSFQALEAIYTGDRNRVVAALSNHLELITGKLYPEVLKIKQKLYDLGAKKAIMSGSGPTVYAVVDDETMAQRMALLLKNDYSQVYVTSTI